NPLTAINLRLYALQKSLSDSADEHQDAAVIRREVRRLNAILEDFLQLDRTPEPQFVSLSTNTVLKEARDLMAPQLERQGIKLKLDPSENGPIRADPHQLQQLLINLIKNAAESIGHDGLVT